MNRITHEVRFYISAGTKQDMEAEAKSKLRELGYVPEVMDIENRLDNWTLTGRSVNAEVTAYDSGF